MATLLVLGSKPDPSVPADSAFAAVACANASGFSARRLGLPDPEFTVMSSVLTSGKNDSNRLALAALGGLSTGTVYYCPRKMFRNDPLKRLLNLREVLATGPRAFERGLRRAGCRFEAFVNRPLQHYLGIVRRLCGDDDEVSRLLQIKHPSTGIMAVAIGLGERGYDSVILGGFSFEITHAYADNPLIRSRGTKTSKHADTDIAVLRCLSRKLGAVSTTEPVVREHTGIPLVEGVVTVS